MFLQAGGGGKGIRPGQQRENCNNNQQPNHQQATQQQGHFRTTVDQVNTNNGNNLYVGQHVQHSAHSFAQLHYHHAHSHALSQQQQHTHHHAKPNQQQTALQPPPCPYFNQYSTTTPTPSQSVIGQSSSSQTISVSTSSLASIENNTLVSSNNGSSVSSISDNLTAFATNNALLHQPPPPLNAPFVTTYMPFHHHGHVSQTAMMAVAAYNNGTAAGNATQNGSNYGSAMTQQSAQAATHPAGGPPHLHGTFFYSMPPPTHNAHGAPNIITNRTMLPPAGPFLNPVYFTSTPPPLLGSSGPQQQPPILGPRAAAAVGPPTFLSTGFCQHMPLGPNMGTSQPLIATSMNTALPFPLNPVLSGTSLMLGNSSNSDLSSRERVRKHAIPIINPDTNEDIFGSNKDTNSIDSSLEINDKTEVNDGLDTAAENPGMQRNEEQVQETKNLVDSDEASTATPTPYSTADSTLTSQTPSEASPVVTANTNGTAKVASAENDEEITIVLEETVCSTVTTTAANNAAAADVENVTEAETKTKTTAQFCQLSIKTSLEPSNDEPLNPSNNDEIDKISSQVFTNVTIPPPPMLCREPPPVFIQPLMPPPTQQHYQHQQSKMNRRAMDTKTMQAGYQDNRVGGRRRDNRQQPKQHPDNRSAAVTETANIMTGTSSNAPKHILQNPFKTKNLSELPHLSTMTSTSGMQRDITSNVGNRDMRPPYASVVSSGAMSKTTSAQQQHKNPLTMTAVNRNRTDSHNSQSSNSDATTKSTPTHQQRDVMLRRNSNNSVIGSEATTNATAGSDSSEATGNKKNKKKNGRNRRNRCNKKECDNNCCDSANRNRSSSASTNRSDNILGVDNAAATKHTWTRNIDAANKMKNNETSTAGSKFGAKNSTTEQQQQFAVPQSTNNQTDKNYVKVNVSHVSSSNVSSNAPKGNNNTAATGVGQRQTQAQQQGKSSTGGGSQQQHQRAQQQTTASINRNNNNNNKQTNLTTAGNNFKNAAGNTASVVRILAKGEKLGSEFFAEQKTTIPIARSTTTTTHAVSKQQVAATAEPKLNTEAAKIKTLRQQSAAKTEEPKKVTHIETQKVDSTRKADDKVGDKKKMPEVAANEKHTETAKVNAVSPTVIEAKESTTNANTATVSTTTIKANIAEDTTTTNVATTIATISCVDSKTIVDNDAKTDDSSASSLVFLNSTTSITRDDIDSGICDGKENKHGVTATELDTSDTQSDTSSKLQQAKTEKTSSIENINFSKPPPTLGNTTSSYAQLVAKNHAQFGSGLCAPSSIVDPSKFIRDGILRYPIEILREMSKSTLSQKPPPNMSKNNAYTHLFCMPKPEVHHVGMMPMSLQSNTQYQHMNFNESMDFMPGKRGRASTKRHQESNQSGNAAHRERNERNASSGGGGGSSLNNNIDRAGPTISRKGDIIHVHLSLKENIKLSECENAWQPSTLRNISSRNSPTKNDDMEATLKVVRGVLNKLTPDNFDVLLKTMSNITMNTQEKMQQVMLLIFEKTVSEPNFAPTYAKFCKTLFQEIKIENKNMFTTSLITRIQQEFENNVNDADAKRVKLQPLMDKMEECTDAKERADLQAEIEDQEYQFRRRAWGTVRFIGEMYKLQSLTSDRVFTCIESLLEHGSEEKLEYMCKLLTTVGHLLEISATLTVEQAKTHNLRMDRIFTRINDVVTKARKNSAKISSRVRFMMQDVMDLRARHWDQSLPSGGSTIAAGTSAGGATSQQSSSNQTQSTQETHQRQRNKGFSSKQQQKDDKFATATSHDDDVGNKRAFDKTANRTLFGHHQRGATGARQNDSNFFGGKNKKSNAQAKEDNDKQVNIDVSKLRFSSGCDDETLQPSTKLGNSSMYQWRMAGRQSSQNSLLDTATTATAAATAAAMTTIKEGANIATIPTALLATAAHKTKRTSGANKFEVLEETLEKSPNKKQANDSAEETDDDNSAAAKNTGTTRKETLQSANLNEKQCQELLNRLVEELFDKGDDTWHAEAENTWLGINEQQQNSVLHHLLIEYLHLVQVKQAQRKACAKIFMHLMQLPQFNKELVFQQAYARFAQEFPDMLWDVPNGWDYLFDFLGPLMHAKILHLTDVWCAEWIEHAKCTESFLKAMLHHFNTEFGQEYTRDLWHKEYKLQHGQQFMPDAQRWQAFVSNNKFESILQLPSKESSTQEETQVAASSNKTPEKTESKQETAVQNTADKLERVKYLLNTGTNTQPALDFINTNVNINTSFIISLTKLLCNDYATTQSTSANNNNNAAAAATVAGKKQRRGIVGTATSSNNKTTASDIMQCNKRQLNTAVFHSKCMPLLRRCLEEQVAHEYSCLTAVHDTLHQMCDEQTAGELTSGIYNILHDTGVVSKNTFERWLHENAALLDGDGNNMPKTTTTNTAATSSTATNMANKKQNTGSRSKINGKNKNSPKHVAAAAVTTTSNNNNNNNNNNNTVLTCLQIFRDKLNANTKTGKADNSAASPTTNNKQK